MKPDVPHAKVVQIAQNYNELMRLQREKDATMAVMIRECMRRIEAASAGHWDIEDQRKAKRERAEAIAGLKAIVDQLEASTKASGTLTLSNEGK